MKLQTSVLLQVLTPFIPLVDSILLSHVCQDRRTPPSKSSAPAAPLSHSRLKALGIEGDAPVGIVATLAGQMKFWCKELETVKTSNVTLL